MWSVPREWSSSGPPWPSTSLRPPAPPSAPYPAVVAQQPANSIFTPYAQPLHPPPAYPRSQPSPSTSRVPSPPTQAPSMSGRQRSSSNDVAFHPYKPPVKASSSSSSPPAPKPPSSSGPMKPILFVDTTQQASGQLDAMQQCRPKRKRITPEQLVRLTAVFDTTDSPSYDVRDKLGAEIGMTNREVQVWFQNRRAKVNRQRQAELAKLATEQQEAQAKMVAVAAPPPRPPVEKMSAGQHQWRFRSTSASQYATPLPPASYAQPPPVAAYSMGPPSPRRLPVQLPSSPHPPAVHPSYRHPFSPQPPQSHYPPTSIALPPPPTSFAPASYSPGAPMHSPSLGHGHSSSFSSIVSPALSGMATPSLTSPGSVASSYFSRQEPPFTPLTVESQSPSNTFFRLTLESPRPDPLSPRHHAVPYEPPSPKPDAPEAPIHLAPIRNLDFRPRPRSKGGIRPSHRRSISDSAAHASFLPPPPRPAPRPTAAVASSSAPTVPTSASVVRLPSLRGLLNDDASDSSPPLGVVSAPTSPVDSLVPLPSTSTLSPPVRPAPYTMPLSSRPFPRHNSRDPSPSTSGSSGSVLAQPALPQPRPRLISRYSTLNIHRQPSVERRSPPQDITARMDVDGRRDEDVDQPEEEEDEAPVPAIASGPPLGLGMLCAAALEAGEDAEKEKRLAEAQGMR
ncbi:hypothetical protein JCM8097_006404 [Rhodosporidiobolus ruineniae]